MKLITIITIFPIALLSCSEAPLKSEIVVRDEGKGSHEILITIEGKENAAIDDPYRDELQALSRELKARRKHFIRNHERMTSEERRAYGEFRDQSAGRIRELNKLRREYIRAKMQELNGSGYRLDESGFGEAVEGVNEYFENLEKSQ